MLHRMYSLRGSLVWLVLLSTTLFALPTLAQSRQPFVDSSQVQQVLEQGLDLERERRWGEALTHYEDALRSHPDQAELEQRLSLSRIHFDLSRRYADSSYVRSVREMSEIDAIEMYAEVLLKIHTHFVTTPQWQELNRQGTDNLEVALADPIFLRVHVPKVRTNQLNAFRQELRQQMNWRQPRNRHEARDAVSAAAALAWRRLQLPPSATIMEYTCGALSSLDDYSAFLTPTQLDDVYSQIEGNFVGLGIELKAAEGSLLIVNVLSHSPAERGGIRSGDRIIEVDGKPTSGTTTEKAADMLKGREGSTVRLIVKSTDVDIPRRIELRRERVDVPSIEGARIVDRASGVGYLKLTSFQKTTSRDLDDALWKLDRNGMKSLVIDVRGNPGGLLSAAIDVTDKFVDQGRIVSTRGRDLRESFDYKAHRVGTWRVPLVVLVDQESASASEIFAAAIHDLRRGTIVGQTSYGKGSVQGIFPLSGESAGVRLTTSKFFAPSGQPISKHGVSPHVVVHVTRKPGSTQYSQVGQDTDDPFVTAAVEAARRLVAQR